VNQIATKPADLPANVEDLSGGLLGVIARAARDPNVDIDKMERLLEMQERVLARQAKEEYDAALALLQPDLPVISERGKILNKNGGVQSTYALWEDVNEAIRPLLAEHGFALSFKTGRQGDQVTVTGILSHRLGHREETTVELPSDGSGSKNAVQAIGSSTSYGKRYAAFALLNITSKGEDDDGQTATKYQASGEPMPRAKLDGLHSSKTALRNAINGIIAEVRNALTVEDLELIQKRNIETIKQANVDWPALLTGDPNISEDIGLKGEIERQRELLSEDGQFAILVRSMKECQTLQSLTNWMSANESFIETLDGAESRKFEMAYNLHESSILETAKATA
jgi:hypothetical protein